MRLLKTLAYVALGVVSFVYILNPTAGVLELIPDNLPIVGNLDEAAAVGLLVLAYKRLRSLHAKQPAAEIDNPDH